MFLKIEELEKAQAQAQVSQASAANALSDDEIKKLKDQILAK